VAGTIGNYGNESLQFPRLNSVIIHGHAFSMTCDYHEELT